MAKTIMIQGTMSNVGKSLLTAGLCRIFKQDGYKTVPFKSQNMSLNSYITKDGLEMGRAQVMQAEAAGIEPSVSMNPILLKPSSDTGSQVILNGKVLGNMSARDYFVYKKTLIPEIQKAFDDLSRDNDIVVIEGAGSPAEINLKQDDIVNMGMAKLANAPVLLVGDIDRGGVFAQLIGTVMLLTKEEQKRIKGLVINKFRGDKTILDPGVSMLEEKAQIPVVGVTPYMDIEIDDEDSLTERFDKVSEKGLVDIAVIRLPRISNFTDFNVFELIPHVSLRYVKNPRDLGNPDLILLPGSKNTIEDLLWLRQSGLEDMILRKAGQGTIIFGICGGIRCWGRSCPIHAMWRREEWSREWDYCPLTPYFPEQRQGAGSKEASSLWRGIFLRSQAHRLKATRSIWGIPSSTERPSRLQSLRIRSMVLQSCAGPGKEMFTVPISMEFLMWVIRQRKSSGPLEKRKGSICQRYR